MQEDLLHGAISCTAIVQYFLSNIQAQQHLNVFLSVYDKEALTQAIVVDQKIKNGKAGKLAGLIVGIKDVLAYKDHPLQAASKMLNGFYSQYTATAVQRLLDEDAIIIGRQNCDEFAMGSSNENSAFGSVLNAIDNNRVPGGSSGGSAVAVMADMCHVSLGSDTGGSVRQPAAFCGVLGLKPTYSRISRHGLVAFGSSFDCIGIFGNHVDDVALVLEQIAGADEFDSTVSQNVVSSYSNQLTETQKFSIAYIPETIENPALQPEIKATIEKKLGQLKEAGHQVEPVNFPLMDYCLPTYYILATAEASANLSRYDGVRYGHRSADAGDLTQLYKQSRTECFGGEVKRRILLGTYILSASYYDTYYAKAQKVRRLIREQTKALFQKYDILIMPTTPTTAFPLGKNTDDPMAMYLADIYSVHANVAGIPGISVPCGVDHQGLPIGLQLLADDFEEGKLLAFADFLMKLKGDV
ncbi:Asp-tRNA(Asn)/Glu-tRNA(Gln) amidotransferase subunit GatA [Chryseotalea sanaruensis]|uniref:Glutamyl-tRNA(Gln) amidotransferase subunit A n=1 Tax=Chryseotalea sanaruensis TaxID=2482724 RepID=A0A401UFB2_9BACT|nr:Asp-tRNA(Asn)/Glu-tRNA(Gln) amidotransferase subunit GatA [Chryseotalea sanaruensis]GCC53601.1 Asp-tRNA(Asn)/Glu-tRNA(Gln) amidotransferase subunit GatA [Chryseotalea sanaruensis]